MKWTQSNSDKKEYMSRSKGAAQISISMLKSELEEIERLAREAGLTRSEFIRNVALHHLKKGMFEIEYTADKPADIFMFLYGLAQQEPAIKLKTSDNGHSQRVEVAGCSIEFISKVLERLRLNTKIQSIKLDFESTP